MFIYGKFTKRKKVSMRNLIASVILRPTFRLNLFLKKNKQKIRKKTTTTQGVEEIKSNCFLQQHTEYMKIIESQRDAVTRISVVEPNGEQNEASFSVSYKKELHVTSPETTV